MLGFTPMPHQWNTERAQFYSSGFALALAEGSFCLSFACPRLLPRGKVRQADPPCLRELPWPGPGPVPCFRLFLLGWPVVMVLVLVIRCSPGIASGQTSFLAETWALATFTSLDSTKRFAFNYTQTLRWDTVQDSG